MVGTSEARGAPVLRTMKLFQTVPIEYHHRQGLKLFVFGGQQMRWLIYADRAAAYRQRFGVRVSVLVHGGTCDTSACVIDRNQHGHHVLTPKP